jgi:hypothetical protein
MHNKYCCNEIIVAKVILEGPGNGQVLNKISNTKTKTTRKQK